MGTKLNLEKKLNLLKKDLLNKKADAFDIYIKNDITAEDDIKKNILELELEIENVELELITIRDEEIRQILNRFNSFNLNTNDIQSSLPIIKSLSTKKFNAAEKKEALKKVVEFINSL